MEALTHTHVARLRLIHVALTLWAVLAIAITTKHLIAPGTHSVYPGYAQTARDLAANRDANTCYAVQHLPYFGDLLQPFSLLSDRAGGLVWLAGSLALLCTGLRAFVDRFAQPFERDWVLACSLIIALAVGIGSLGNAQSNIMITGCLLWGTVAVAEKRWWLAALLLALPAFKLYPLALGLVYAALYPRKFAPRFAMVVAGLLALPFLLHHDAIVAARYQGLWEYLTSGTHYTIYSFLNVRDSLAHYGWVLPPKYFLPIQAATGGTIVLLAWRDRWRGLRDDDVVLRVFVLTSLWFVTFGPSVEWQTYLLAAPALGWAGARLWNTDRPTVAGLVLVAAVVVLGPLQTSLFGMPAQRAARDSKVTCWLMLAIMMWQIRATAKAAPPATLPMPTPSHAKLAA